MKVIIRSTRFSSVFMVLVCLWLVDPSGAMGNDSAAAPQSALWQGNVEELFQKGRTELGISFGPGFGMAVLGSTSHQDWVLGMVEHGWMLSDVVGQDHWYRGNLEVVVDLFGGFQYHPAHGYVVGAGPALRYNFVTGTRWVPFFSAGAGISFTDIRGGDLSTEFEFNLRAGPGIRYFVSPRLAASLQYQLIHLSNAGMKFPNLGINNNTILFGVNWFF